MNKIKKISRRTWTMISTVLVLVGIVMYAYPRIANLLSQEYTNLTIKSFEETVQSLQVQEVAPETTADAAMKKDESHLDASLKKEESYLDVSLKKEESYLHELLKMVGEYNQKLYDEGQKDLVDPFSYEVSSFDLSEFGIEDDMFGYIKIPKLSLVMAVYLGATSTNMSKGAVHLTQTSLPISGNNTNAVIAAHRGSRYGEMFLYINKLEIGDEVTISNAWETLAYSVTSTAIIAPNEVDKVLIQEGRDMVTLISCNPYGKSTQRYVVYCDRVTQD